MARKSIPQNTELDVLLHSRRRCAICFGLKHDTKIKKGQIAHIDQNNTNSNVDNLVFLCLEHHDEYDSRSSQSKGITSGELKRFRNELNEYMTVNQNLFWTDYSETEKGFTDSKRPHLSVEIYDRKIQIYRTVREFLGVIFREATVSLNQLFQFARDTDEVIFLFDSELSAYLQNLYQEANRLSYTHERLINQSLPIGEERSKLAEENAELLIWFSNQFEVTREMFYKHISLG